MPISKEKIKSLSSNKKDIHEELNNCSDELFLDDLDLDDEEQNIPKKIGNESKKNSNNPAEPLPKEEKIPSYIFRGYNLSALNEKERDRFEKLQLTEEMIGNFYLSNQTMCNIYNCPEYHPSLSRKWGFPKDGLYLGWIYKFRKNTNEYGEEFFILSFLASEYDIVYLKFRRSFSDVIYNSVKNAFGLNDNLFRKADFSVIEGLPVFVKINNIKTTTGKNFSEVISFDIIRDDDVDLILKVADEMLKN